MPWQRFARSEEIGDDRFTLRAFGRRTVGVTRVRGKLHAVLDYCPHAGAPICAGRIGGLVTSDRPGQLGYDAERIILRCPWHHWEFDLETGAGTCAATGRIKTFPVKEDGGEVWVDI